MSAQPAQFRLPFTHYAALGYHPIPTDGKRPVGGTGWNQRVYTHQEYTGLDATQYNVGLLCSNVVGIDIDVQDAKHAKSVERVVRKVLKLPKDAPRRVGAAPKALFICRVEQPTKGFDIANNEQGNRTVLFQLLGDGKQFVIDGTHPDTHKPYTLNAPLPAWDKLPLVTPETLEALRTAVMETLAGVGYKVVATGGTGKKGSGKWSQQHPWTERGMTLAWDELEKLDPDMQMNEWAKVGMALHDGTHGSDEGLAMWDAWSQRGEKYVDRADLAGRWRGFKPGGGTGAASLFKNDWPKLEPGSSGEPVVVQAGPGDEFFTTSDALLATPFAVRRQFVEDTIQVGATLVHGPGKKGKSWWLLDMADHVAHGKEMFINRRVHQAKVLLIGAEDMAHRFKERLSIMGIYGTPNLVLMHREQLKAWGEKFQPMMGDDVVPWTPALAIETLHRQTGAEVIICDTQEVFELTLEIEHGDRSTSLTRQHYMSTSSYDEVAQRMGLAIILVAHWGAIKSLPMAVTNPHEMINTTKTKIAGALTSITLGPLANQELDDDSGQAQLSVMGKDISTGNRYEAIERDPKTQRHKYLGTAREVILRESLREVMVALEQVLSEKGPGGKATSSEIATVLGISRGDTVRKKIAAIEKNAQIQATRKGLSDGRVHWKQYVLRSSTAGYWLEME